MTILDTPLTRQQQKYERLLAEKDDEIAALRTQIATVRGINDLLKYELVALESVFKNMHKNLDEAGEHVRVLRLNLPDIEK